MSPFSDFESLSLLLDTSLGRTLLIADPHIGFELSRGLRIKTGFEESLARFIVESGADALIILGDVKEPLGLSFRLKEMLLRFFSALKDVRIIVTKGNHDGRIEEVTGKFPNVEVREHLLLDGKLFLHGHTRLPKIEFEEAFLGHAHPAYTLESGGVARKVKVFARVNEFLVLPTVNPYIEGFDVREGIKLVPFLRKAREIELFLPEGLYLGRLEL
ncbi:Putative ICC-like phosphoesterase [Thermococcus nautili]|uniref:metallophosphoesterase n=1 Tax=Thermococcus nautili TaxID=195522 RepID=UPI002553A14A|nr:metallophosphoesterase [Thermococcus nautili]CAI1492325.1 Putative ICC-like phosphoesterase [Thermococcus nautili]